MAPSEYFDFPNDVSKGDGTYTMKTWAEDDEGLLISPQETVVLSGPAKVRVSPNSDYSGYRGSGFRYREWEDTDDGLTLAVYGLSIPDN